MEKRRKIERLKTAAIVLLSVSAIALGIQEGVLGGVSQPAISELVSLFRGYETVSEQISDAETHTAVLPLYAVVTNSDGEHYGIKYDSADLKVLYDRMGNLFSEALGSARNVEAVGDNELRTALSGESVFFDYVNPVDVPIMAAWLGTEAGDDISDYSVRRICVAEQDGDVVLYLKDHASGTIYRAETAIAYQSFETRIREYSPNSAVFAYELDDSVGDGDDYQFLLPGTKSYAVIEKSSPLDSSSVVDKVLGYFDISSYVNSRYSESDGTIVFVESDYTLRLNIANGTVVLRRPVSGDGTIDELTAIDDAYSIINETVAAYCGDAQVQLYNTVQSGDGYVLNFKYYINSSEITGNESGAAKVTISGGEITELYLYFGSWTVSDESIEMLPEILAAAAADGSELAVVYSDSGDGKQYPEWIVR